MHLVWVLLLLPAGNGVARCRSMGCNSCCFVLVANKINIVLLVHGALVVSLVNTAIAGQGFSIAVSRSGVLLSDLISYT